MMTSARGGRPSSSSAPTYSWAPTTFVSASGKRIHREMVELNNDPPPHCSAGPKDDNLYHGIATIIGPLDGWSPALTITKVLTAIRSLLTNNPDPYKAVVPGIAHLYLENKAKHDIVAGEWTARFAK
ncbi:constitutive photomorphogenesis protein 10-like isoform X2 [Arachis ipaensis]|uniref:constitutive photomorphogenesis protein 10-like isoform X2 n=1 Tax=Arachis ipaensis TaxID=130454 RepID=UPI000A2B4A6C|nr:constitutive photomorphogenesis protein 10-like isoform X2 [Arachis ipaensis]